MTLLSDPQVRAFLRDGFITVDATLDAGFHAHVHRQITDLFASDGNPGNDILPRVPDLHRVLTHPKVAGTLTSLLGPDYLLHPHRHCHLNPAGSDGQRMHQDSYERDQNVRHHRVRWLMAFYYPQDVDEQRGPSSVVPATQYLTEEDQDGSPAELPVVGAAGTVTIVHYDLWHRAMANVGERDRYMVKFLFTRMCEPRAAAWNHDGNGWRPTGRADDTICAHLWAWMRGATEGAGPPPATPEELARRLRDGAEVERYDAAYRLGAMGGLPSLLEALREEGECRLAANLERSHTNPAQLDAAYGMTAVGSEAVPTLVDLLAEERWWLRASAADVLGDIGLPAAGSASALASALEDESEWVRRNAAEALGNIGPAAARTASALCARLTDADVAVRHNAALALAKMGTGDATALRRAQDDDDHYVRELSTVALARFQPVQ